ncbi:MAG: hypothetical protein H6692_05405 [Gemmatimonadales bacterium]|nr:hypothetical protein [Gemmatimonadales bacterium]
MRWPLAVLGLEALATVTLTGQAVPASLLAPPDSLGDRSRYRAAVTQLCPGTTADRDELFRTEAAAAARATRTDTDPAAWLDLACARAHLDLDDAWSRESLGMPLGTPWQTGATTAAIRAGALGGAPRATELLAVLALDQSRLRDPDTILAQVQREAISGPATPATVRACVVLAREAGRPSVALACLEAGLAAGGDSTWQLLARARLAAAEADTASTSTLVRRALTSAADAAAWREVGWHLRWFLDPEEWDEWSTLPDGDRARWVTARLATRDVRDGRAFGSRILEHFRRLDVADREFRIRLERRQAGRVLAAATSEPSCRNPEYVSEWWDPALIPALPFREYQRWNLRYDDRAVVYLRFGEPDERIRWSAADTVRTCEKPGSPDPTPAAVVTNTREAWAYDRGTERLLLHFESERFVGSTDATRLVAGVLGHYLCDVDTRRCLLSQQSEMAFNGSRPVPVEQLQAVRSADLEQIATATTTDDNGLQADRPLTTVATLSRVWDPASGAVLAVVPYAVRVGDLAVASDANTAEVDLTLRQWNPALADWQATAVTRRLRLPASADDDARVTGFLVTPSTVGVETWSLVAAQDSTRAGRAFADVAPIESGGLVLSDLILGAVSQGQAWQTSTGREVPLAPLGAFDRTETVTLYWQARSDRPRLPVRTTIRLFRVAGRGGERPALEVAVDGEVGRGLTEFQRELGVARLETGRYRVEVEMSDPVAGATARRSARLLLR